MAPEPSQRLSRARVRVTARVSVNAYRVELRFASNHDLLSASRPRPSRLGLRSVFAWRPSSPRSARSLANMEFSGRRSTMQPHADPYGGARSNLPVPSTIKKPASGHGRMSLAGPAIRAPYPMPPPSNPRQSLMRSQMNPLLQSTSKPQNYGRTPVNK